jgi:hypothetical protein
MAHAAMDENHEATAQAASAHCHHRDMASLGASAQQNQCPCCTGGHACQCGYVVAFAPPLAVVDLSSEAPPTLAGLLRVPELAPPPRHRLLRPPII